MLKTAIDSFRLDVGRLPSSDEGLEALIENPGSEKWQGPYLAGDVNDCSKKNEGGLKT